MDDLRTLTNYKSSFALLRVFVMVLVVVFAASMIAMFVYSNNLINKHVGSIWVMDRNGSIYSAEMEHRDLEQYRRAEYYNHIKMLYASFFSYDAVSYDQNIDQGLHLLGESGEILHNHYKEQSVRRKVIENNLIVYSFVDSVLFDFSVRPVTGIAYGQQITRRKGGELIKNLHSTFTIVDLNGRTMENPHGALVEDLKIIDNSRVEQ